MLKKLEKIHSNKSASNYIYRKYADYYLIAKRNLVLTLTILAILFSVAYWLLIASDRYVSESHVIVQQTDIAGGSQVDFAAIISGGGGANRADQLLLRDYLLSVDLLRKVDAHLNLKAHFSDTGHDIFSRMWFKNPEIERLYNYYLSRVSVELDDYSGVLIIKAEAYDPQMASALVAMLVLEGEIFMNALSNNLAQDQVAFLEKQVAKNIARALEARQVLLSYQDEQRLVSPQAAAESIVATVSSLEAQRAVLETQLLELQSYLVASHHYILRTQRQIEAVTRQIIQEKSKLASPDGGTLNRTVEQFQRLEMEAEFTFEVYKTTLIALEKMKVEAARAIKKLSVLQSPTMPEYPLQPRRIYNSIVSMLFIMMMAGMANLLLAIVRDHKD